MTPLFIILALLSISHTAPPPIPSNATGVLIFNQGSHTDWDWLNVFTTNVNNTPRDQSGIGFWWTNQWGGVQPTDVIFSSAVNLLKNNPGYKYSVEMIAFIREFSKSHPDDFKKLVSERFSFTGGGITTPDNLLPSGEAYIRNYMSGKRWLQSVGLSSLWNDLYWMPDDFGHDSQLPVTLQALGAKGVGFARVPGSCQQGNYAKDDSQAHQILTGPGGAVDFRWVANDGSSVYAHYMPSHYCAADSIHNTRDGDYGTADQIRHCQAWSYPATVNEHIWGYWVSMKDFSYGSPYVFVQAGCDNSMPINDLQTLLDQWNARNFSNSGVYALTASWEDYRQLLNKWMADNGKQMQNRTFDDGSFRPTPYWQGYYASRAYLKQTHYNVSRLLIQIETLNAIAVARYGSPIHSQSIIDDIWDDFSPSTHHDFITGTATDVVVTQEQNPKMAALTKQVGELLDYTLDALVSQEPRHPGLGSLEVVNTLGWNRKGIALLRNSRDVSQSAWNLINSKFLAANTSEDDKIVYVTQVPPLGFQNYDLSLPQPREALVPCNLQVTTNSYVLSNGFLRATFNKDIEWGIAELFDLKLNQTVVTEGNRFEYRNDGGNIYQYGFEEDCGFDKFSNLNVVVSPMSVIAKTTLSTTLGYHLNVSGSLFPETVYYVEYTLRADEPLLRVSVTGKAPDRTVLFTKITYPEKIGFYEYGTPTHWTRNKPMHTSKQLDWDVTFEATHNFFQPYGVTALGSIYHADIPAWGAHENTVYGTLFRNSPQNCASKGAAGTDRGTHTFKFAIRVLDGLKPASSGIPKKESLEYQNPLYMFYNQDSVGTRYSLASFDGPVLVTGAKMGTFSNDKSIYVRMHQPTNTPGVVNTQFYQDLDTPVYSTTALEVDIQAFNPTGTRSIQLNPTSALTTWRFALRQYDPPAAPTVAPNPPHAPLTPASPVPAPANITPAPATPPPAHPHAPIAPAPPAPTPQPGTPVVPAPANITPSPVVPPAPFPVTPQPYTPPTVPIPPAPQAPTGMSPTSIAVLVTILVLVAILLGGGFLYWKKKKNPYLSGLKPTRDSLHDRDAETFTWDHQSQPSESSTLQ